MVSGLSDLRWQTETAAYMQRASQLQMVSSYFDQVSCPVDILLVCKQNGGYPTGTRRLKPLEK